MAAHPTIWGLHHNAGLDLVGGSFIAIGWPEAGSLEDLASDRDLLKERLRDAYPATSDGWIANAAGQLLRFRHSMAVGDLVVYPRKSDRTINIGRIAGDYVFDFARSPEYPNHRPIDWVRTELPRDAFTQGCLYEFGSALSVFTISNHASEVHAALGGGSSAGATSGQTSTTGPAVDSQQTSTPAVPGQDEPNAERITELTQDFVLKTFKTQLKGHGFAEFCGWLLEGLGYSTQVSPPGADRGIDIVASEDPLGVKQPLLKVQCKSSTGPTSAPDVQALNGTLSPTDLGVFIAVGGYTAQARRAAETMPSMRLLGPTELVELVLDHYSALPDEAKQALPLRRVWMPDRGEAAE